MSDTPSIREACHSSLMLRTRRAAASVIGESDFLLQAYLQTQGQSDVSRRLTREDVLEHLSDLFIRRGVPDDIRSDNGPEFTANCVKERLAWVELKTLFIEPGSPWENGSIESSKGNYREELLDGEIFDTLLEAKVMIEQWRVENNTIRPHSALGYWPPPETLPEKEHKVWFHSRRQVKNQCE